MRMSNKTIIMDDIITGVARCWKRIMQRMSSRSPRQMFLVIILLTSLVTMFYVNFLFPNRSWGIVTLYSSEEEEWRGLNVTAPCIDRLAPLAGRVEDVFCLNLPAFSPKLKNPCLYEYQASLSRPVLRCLPYFYILGMDKCGTTDLHNRISFHPDVRKNNGELNKETEFWSWSRYGVKNKNRRPYKKYLTEYFKMFDLTSTELEQHGHPRSIVTGDATPMDLWDFRYWDLIPQNFNKDEPEILTPHLIRYLYKDRQPKLLIQLRDPIERLYSDYIFLNYGINAHTFHAHVLKAIKLIQTCLETKSIRLCFFDKDIYRKLTTRIHLGCYSVFIKEWLAVFPRSSFHFTRTEDFHLNTKKTLTDIFSFLDLEPLSEDALNEITNQTQRHVTKSKKGQILPETFSALYKFYLPCLMETASLLNDDERYLWQDIYTEQGRFPLNDNDGQINMTDLPLMRHLKGGILRH